MQEKLEGEDPWLNFLREETPYLEDAGFTDQLMRELPAPSRLRERIIAGTFVGAFFALALGLFFTQLPLLELLWGFRHSPSLFWGFWGLSALLLYVIVDEKVAEA